MPLGLRTRSVPPDILHFLARIRFSLFGVTVGSFSQDAKRRTEVSASKKYFMLYMIYLTVKATNYN